MKQMYGPVWNGAAQALRDIFADGYPADKVIQRHMKMNKKWGSSDRRLFAETVYDMVRWWIRLQSCLGGKAEYGAAVSAWCVLQGMELPKNVLACPISQAELKQRWEDPPSRAVRESIPDWLDVWGEAELGGKWESVLGILNSTAPVYLRTNRLKTTPEKLLARLRAEKYEA